MKISKFAVNFRKVLGPVIAVLLCLATYIPAASPVRAAGNGTGILWGFSAADTSNNPILGLVGLGSVASFDAGFDGHSLAVTTGGNVYAWGDNSYGQLGQGTFGSSNITVQNPVEVKGPGGVGYLTGVQSVSAGEEWSVAVKTDGTVWAWGDNSGGYLGNGTIGTGSTQFVTTPVQVIDPTDNTGYLQNVKAVSAGYEITLALKNDGTVWSWGYNDWGEIGNGTHGNGTIATTAVPTPVQVAGGAAGTTYLTGIKSICASNAYCVALTTGGNVYTWGCNTWNNLGINETSSQLYRSLTPVEVVGVGGTGHLSGIDQISSRGVQCLAFSASAGNVIYGWGSDVYGCLGQPYTNNNTTIPYIAAPIQVYVIGAGSGSGIGDEGVMIGAGMYASIIKMPDGSIGVFGTSFGTTTSQGNIIHFWGLHDVSDISAGSAFYIMGPPRTATTTVVTSSVPSPSNWGQDVTFTATVTPTGSYTPTGQLNFGLNGSPTGSLSTTLNTSAQSTYTIPGSWMQGGNNSIPAQYLGDYNNAPSTSPAFTQTVTKLNATVTFTSAPNPSAAGQNVTFTITVSGPADDPVPTGYVSFTNGDGGSVLLNNGTATITLSTLTTGSTHFTAVYNGDSNYSSAQSVDAVQVVTLNTSHIALLSSKNPATTGDNITFNISVSGSAGTPTGSAVLYDGDNTLTTLTLDGSGNASYSTTGLASGNHTIVAHYNGDGNYNSSDSGSLQQSVNAPGSQVVTFPDSRLEAVIRNALDKPTGDIHVSDLAALTVLNGYGQSIANLTGLQYCTGLTNLNLNSNQITDISQLASLTNLTRLDIQGNQITDVSPLSSLVHLTYVELDDNNITDMAPLTALVNLTELDLNYNQIVTIPDISGLTQLQTLYLADNQIQDISNITSLSSSVISSLLLTGDPLGNNTLNPAPDFSNLANLYYLGLDRTSLKAMPGLSGLGNLAYLELSNNQITVISDLSGLSALNNIDLSNNYLTSISPLQSAASFHSGGVLDLSYNYLNVTDGSPTMVTINSFTSKGVTVTYSPQNSAPALLVVSTMVLPDSYVNGPYNFTLSATGGAGNNTWTVSGGTMPIGLLLSSGGVISGTPTVKGKYSFTVHVADPLSNSATQNLTVNINSAGNVYDWGSNVYGQLGNNTNTDITSGATPLSGMTGVVEISTDAFFTLVLKSDGTVWSFGDNSSGQLGNNTTNNSNVPVQVLGPLGQGYLSNVIAISAGAHLGVALKSDGTVWDWGINSVNSLGSLGDGTYNDSYVPVQVKDPSNDGYLTGIVAIASGGDSFNMALKSDGTVYTWGFGGNGELGNNGTGNRNLPVQVLGPGGVGNLSNIIAIAAGWDQALALKSNGTVWAWGDDGEGQDGDNSPGTSANLVPVQVSGLTGITAIAGGDDNSMALKSDGTVWTWGDNSFGELGNGSITPGISYIPVQATSLSGVFTSIASSWRHDMALKSNGTVWAWGDNSGGGLGVPPTSVTHTNQALQVPGIAGGAIAISAGYSDSAAIVIPLSSDSTLSSLTISSGTLTPTFNSTTGTYTDSVANSVTSVTVVPTVHQANATITVNGSPVASGATSGSLSLNNVAPGTNTITVVVTAQDTTVTTYTITVTRAALTSTGKIVFYSEDANGDYEIYIINADGSNRTQLTFDSANDGAPSLSPDGTKIVYTSYRDGHKEIWKMNSDGTGQTRLDDLSSYSSGLTDDNPSWSPDGAKIVFQSDRLVWSHIYIMNADGTGLTQVNNQPSGSDNIYPSYSPDGTKIIFESGNGITINTIKPDGTGLISLYTSAVQMYEPKYAPDGSKISYYLVSTNQIYTMDTSGGTRVNIGAGAEPSWSPDSQFIIYYNGGIKIMSASGSAISSLSSNTYDQDPSWGVGSVVSRTINPAVSFAVYGIATGQPVTAGQQESITVAAKDTGGNPATGYTGTIHFISSDPQAILPADYTFTSADNGVHNFNWNTGGVTLVTAGTQSVTATDKSHSSITGTQSGIQVVSGPLYVLVVSGISNPITVGVPGTVVVRIEDQYGNTVNYNINNSVNIHFTSSDSVAALPANYTFSSADNGVHTFTNGVTFNTSGTQSVTATRTGEYSPITGTQSGITVNPVSSTTTTTTSTTTTTTVNPPSLSRDATLRSLTVSTGTISPVFNSGTTSYTDNVLNSVSSVTVTPTVNQANAIVTVNGVAVSSGTASGSINLNVGDNTITLIVTAQDGSTRAVYMVTVTRAVILSNDATLSNLTISTGTLTPAFAAGTTSYTSGVAYAVTPVTVNATVNESHAAVKVNGVSVTSGSPSGWISLDVGANTITIVVTAQDGITTDTYNIIVNMALLTTTQTTPPVITVTVTNTSSSTTTTSAITTTFPPGTTDLSRDVNSTGTFIFGASASSANGDVTVNIPAGVTGLTAGGAPITQITITPITTDLPALPADGAAVGLYFDIQPSGSTFSSPITITVSYDPSLIPAGISPYVAWYNPATGQWEQLTTVSIDTVNHTITASVNHFSTFAVLAALSKTSTTASTAVGTATSNANTTATTSNATTKPSANGVIIGVIIGAVIVIALILFLMIRRRKPRGG